MVKLSSKILPIDNQEWVRNPKNSIELSKYNMQAGKNSSALFQLHFFNFTVRIAKAYIQT
jgi:hypothetical protein